MTADPVVAYRWQSPIGGWAYGEKVNPHAVAEGYAVQPLCVFRADVDADAARYRFWRNAFLEEAKNPLCADWQLGLALGDATTPAQIDAALDGAMKP